MKNFTLSSMLKRIFTAFVALLCITTVSAQDWTLVEENTMSGDRSTPIEEPIFYYDSWERYQTEFDELNYYPAVLTYGYDYIGVKVEIAEAGEYKYSFDFKNETNDDLTVQLFYDSRSEELNDRRPVSATMDVLEEVQTIESDAINLSAGTYYLAIVTNNENDFANGTMFACANFKLYKKGGAVAPTTYEVTWAAPANGTLVIKNGAEELSSPATVEENTELTVEATANPNYELETLTAGGVDIMADMKFVVTANTEVVATFKESSVLPITNSAIRIPDQEDSKTKMHYQFRFDDELLGDHSSEDNRTRNITMSVWMKPRSVNGQFFGLVQSDFWGAYGTFWVKSVNGKYVLGNRSLKSDGGFENQADMTTDQEVVLNEWAYVTVVINNETKERSIYYNGELLQTSAIINEGLGMLPDASVFFVGAGIIEGSDQEIASDAALDIDEVQVWTKALTASEVKQSMSSIDTKAEGLAYLYRFTSINDDNTFNNLASGDVKASLRYGKGVYDKNRWATIYTSEIVKAEQVEGHAPTVLPTTYQVTWTKPEFGNLIVKNGAEELTSPATVEENTVLTIVPEAEAGYQLVSVTANGNIIEPVEGVYSITVNTETVIAATFETEGPKTREVTWNKYGSKASWGILDIYVDDENLVHNELSGGGVLNITDGQTVKIVTSIPEDKGMATVTVGGKEVELDAEGSYTFIMGPTTTSIDVLFDLPRVTVEMNKVGEGELSITVGGATYGGTNTYLNKDDVFTVNATPAQGYKLESLEVLIGGEAQTGDQFTATADVVINATFVAKTYHTVTLVKPENGDITVQYEEDGRTKVVSTEEFSDDSKTFEVEDNVVLTITAQPDKKYELVAISCNGEELQGSTFTVTAETTISAEFQLKQYTITFEQPENATVNVMNGDNEINSGDKLNAGTEITVVAEAELGYEIEAIKVNDKDITLDGKFTLTEDANIVVIVKIIDAINETAAAEVYYNNAEQAIYTNNAKAVKVYDLSGRLVLNAENQTVVSVNELADGFYTAVVDGTVIKFNK